jgi:hypothetical protein
VAGTLWLAGSEVPEPFEATIRLPELSGDLDDWLKGDSTLEAQGTLRVMLGMGQKDT